MTDNIRPSTGWTVKEHQIQLDSLLCYFNSCVTQLKSWVGREIKVIEQSCTSCSMMEHNHSSPRGWTTEPAPSRLTIFCLSFSWWETAMWERGRYWRASRTEPASLRMATTWVSVQYTTAARTINKQMTYFHFKHVFIENIEDYMLWSPGLDNIELFSMFLLHNKQVVTHSTFYAQLVLDGPCH